MVQNVVTYSTVITVPNPQLKLKPGMTANVTIEILRRNDVLRVANAAMRFRPTAEMFSVLNQPAPPELQRTGTGARGGRARSDGAPVGIGPGAAQRHGAATGSCSAGDTGDGRADVQGDDDRRPVRAAGHDRDRAAWSGSTTRSKQLKAVRLASAPRTAPSRKS